MAYDYKFNIALVGDVRVGKNSLCKRFIDDTFSDKSTIVGKGYHEFAHKKVFLNNKNIKLTVWNVRPNKLLDLVPDGVMIVYDITCNPSFVKVEDKLNEIASVSQNSCKYIVGNKSDMEYDRVVNTNTAKAYAQSKGLKIFETSAKTSANVEECFASMANDLIARFNATQK